MYQEKLQGERLKVKFHGDFDEGGPYFGSKKAYF